MTSSIPPSTDPARAVPSDRLWLRSELMGTQVITRDTGRRLGVVGEVVVDIDRREVMALGLRDNPLTRFLPGLPRWMPLDRIRQVGDVILVDSVDSLTQSFNPERYSKVINSQVVSESGEQLGRVLGFSFDIETGELTTLVLGALGVPLLGEGVLSTWELAVEEIVSSGPDRIIVYEGAEEKLKQLGSGLLEKLGIGGPSWEQEERDRFRQPMVPVENQLTSGQPTAQEQRRIQPATSRALEPQRDEELEYVELDRRRQEPMRQRRYLDDQDDQAEPVRGGREPGRSGPGESEERSRQDRRYEDARYEDRRYEDRRFEDLDPPPFRATPAASERPLPRSVQPRSLQRRPPLDRQEEPLDVDPEPYQEPYQGPYDGPEAQPATFPVDRPERSGFEDPW
ncbi:MULTISPECIES: PRC-barrel domain-containing protein [Synechococcales]|uniref:PRC-barrel domain-containing protein n=1 Tax=unclassified Synechococcus TaxID=2626047 RepID=UPI0021A8D4B4|nr:MULTISPECIES: PRC-barrel domain-containing protein [unclassified Synechococcus]